MKPNTNTVILILIAARLEIIDLDVGVMFIVLMILLNIFVSWIKNG